MLLFQAASSDAVLSRTKLRSCEEQAQHAKEQSAVLDAQVKDLKNTAQAAAEDLQVCRLCLGTSVDVLVQLVRSVCVKGVPRVHRRKHWLKSWQWRLT